MKPALILVAVAFGLFRPVLLFVDFNPHIEAGYEAFAHLLVGGLYGAYISWRASFGNRPLDRPIWMLYSANALTAVEIICAAMGIAMKRGLL